MMVGASDLDFDEQDVAEAFDEDNTNIESMRQNGAEDAEQFEDLVDVYDVTARVGDRDDDQGAIGEEMDDDEIVAAATDADDDSDDLENDDMTLRSPDAVDQEDDLEDSADLDGDDVDGVSKLTGDEVDLEYVGDLNDIEGATSGAADLESDTLSDADLRELDYKKD